MYIEKIILTNFRGASDLTIDLDRHLNVFYGENGAGKSTVLDAAAIMLSWVINRIRNINSSGKHIDLNDIKNGKPYGSIQLVCNTGEESILWVLVKTRKGRTSGKEKTNLVNLNHFAKAVQQKITDDEIGGVVTIPLFVYYPVQRAVVDIPLRIRGKHSFDVMEAYEEALDGGASFRTFFEWFRENEDLENEYNRDLYKKIAEAHASGDDEDINFSYNSEFRAVCKALEQFMPGFKNFTIRRKPLRMEVEKNGQILSVNQLSDGEKCLMAMVGDLARRMAIANPNHSDHLRGEGVVLIDEIDLHLHPKWQRSIITQLEKTFPNIQFIISTHSPHVLNHVQPENLFVLTQTPENIEVSHPYESYGKNVDRVLEDLMGLETTRPTPVQEKLDLLFRTIQEKKLDEAKEMVKALKGEIREDPDLVSAEVYIRRMELIGK